MYLILQALEAVSFIHGLGIAHRDVFLNNFLVEWVPHTLIAGSTRRPTSTRPRLYLIDFEFAVDFPADSLPEDRLLTDFPVSFDVYGQIPAPELLEKELSYCPFRLDIWQLGKGLAFFKSSITEIDDILQSLRNADPAKRPTAIEALDKSDHVMKGLPPSSLHHPYVLIGAL